MVTHTRFWYTPLPDVRRAIPISVAVTLEYSYLMMTLKTQRAKHARTNAQPKFEDAPNSILSSDRIIQWESDNAFPRRMVTVL